MCAPAPAGRRTPPSRREWWSGSGRRAARSPRSTTGLPATEITDARYCYCLIDTHTHTNTTSYTHTHTHTHFDTVYPISTMNGLTDSLTDLSNRLNWQPGAMRSLAPGTVSSRKASR